MNLHRKIIMIVALVFWSALGFGQKYSNGKVPTGDKSRIGSDVLRKGTKPNQILMTLGDSTVKYVDADTAFAIQGGGLTNDRIPYGNAQNIATSESKFLYKNKGILLNTSEDSTAALNILSTDGTVGQRSAIDFIPYSRAYYNSVFPSHPTLRHLEFNPEKLVGIGHGNPYGKFEFRSSFGKDDNLPDTSGNMIHNFGFNIDRTATKTPAMYLSFEQRYTYGLGRQFSEFHLECKDTLGRNYRPLSVLAPYDGLGSQFGLQCDLFSVLKSPPNGSDYWHMQDYSTGLSDYYGNYHIQIRGNTLNNIITKFSKKILTGTTPYSRSILLMDDNDIVHVGDSAGIGIKNTLLITRENATYPMIKSLDRYLRFDSTRLDIYSPDVNGRYINFYNGAGTKRLSFCYEPDYLYLESQASNRPMIIDQRAPTYSLALSNSGHLGVKLGGNIAPYHALEVGGDASFDGYVRFGTTYPIDGTGVLAGSMFRGVDGALYYKSTGSTVTLIAPN